MQSGLKDSYKISPKAILQEAEEWKVYNSQSRIADILTILPSHDLVLVNFSYLRKLNWESICRWSKHYIRQVYRLSET